MLGPRARTRQDPPLNPTGPNRTQQYPTGVQQGPTEIARTRQDTSRAHQNPQEHQKPPGPTRDAPGSTRVTLSREGWWWGGLWGTRWASARVYQKNNVVPGRGIRPQTPGTVRIPLLRQEMSFQWLASEFTPGRPGALLLRRALSWNWV